MKISKTDFVTFNEREAVRGNNFCGNCGEEVGNSDCCEDGYTNCCNEPAISRNNFLKAAKFIDLRNFIEKQNGQIYDQREQPFQTVIELENKKKIHVSTKESLDSIISVMNIYL